MALRDLPGAFLRLNRSASRRQRVLAQRLLGRRNGHLDFARRVVPALLPPGGRVLELGADARPIVDATLKHRFDLHLTALDVRPEALEVAPPGLYDEVVIADITRGEIPGPYDCIVSRCVLEHVQDTRAAMRDLVAALAPGGTLAHYLPCGRAPFAYLNRLIGAGRSRALVHALDPWAGGGTGLRAYYDCCTPSAMAEVCRENGLVDVVVTPHFCSDYLAFFTPLYTLDLSRQIVLQWLEADELAESLTVIARRPAAGASAR